MIQQASGKKPQRISRLLDKYRSLLIVTALFFTSIGASAQAIFPLIGVRQDINAKGYNWKEGSFKALGLPMDTLALRVSDSGFIAYKNNLWIWTGFKWKPACSCSTDTTTTPGPSALAFSLQPTNQTVAEGGNTGFEGAVTGGTTPYEYQWQKQVSSVWTNVSGATSATYNIIGATSGDAGSYRLVAGDAIGGTLISNTVTLTVTTSGPSITIGYSPTDPFVNSSTAPTISNASTFTIGSGAQIYFTLPAAAADKYWVVRVPIDQPAATGWYHNTDNSGPVPGDVVRTWTVGSFRYYSSVSEFVLTYTDPIQLTH